jgi:hypothetical protein
MWAAPAAVSSRLLGRLSAFGPVTTHEPRNGTPIDSPRAQSNAIRVQNITWAQMLAGWTEPGTFAINLRRTNRFELAHVLQPGLLTACH